MVTLRFRGRIAALAALLLLSARVDAQSARVDPAVSSSLDTSGKAIACVCLRDASDRRDPFVVRAEEFARVQDEFIAALPPGRARVRYRYRYSPVLLVEFFDRPAFATATAFGSVEAIGLDETGSGALNQSRAMIGADTVFNLGFTGQGRVAAVLDSGVDATHPDLAAAIVHQYHFLGAGTDVGPGAADGHGHGTNVTGIIASRGTVAPRGVAPGASIISIRVLDELNVGSISDWAAAVEYVVGLHEEGAFAIDAINMSLVSKSTFSEECDSSYVAFSNACRAASEAGIAVFAASGNKGSVTSMTSPACFTTVAAVGSVKDTLPDRISIFTSRNTGLDLLAPGETITSTGLDGGISSFLGTSQATPHATAVGLILREISPALSPQLILKVLQETGVEVFDEGTGLTFRRLDAAAAVDAVHRPGDCNENGISDYVDVVIAATSSDDDLDGRPDECGPPPPPLFVRSDANGDGEVDLSDAVRGFLYLFAGAPVDCEDAVDADDSGEVDISDGIYTLQFLFTDGTPPPAPGAATCGEDTSPDPLGCAQFLPCD